MTDKLSILFLTLVVGPGIWLSWKSVSILIGWASPHNLSLVHLSSWF